MAFNQATQIASLIIILNLLACDSKGQQMTELEQSQLLDKAFTQALSEAKKSSEVLWSPCRVSGGKLDYRYSACFNDITGSAAITMEKLRDILVKAGFETSSTGNMDGELNGVFTLPGTPYELNSSFGSIRIKWVVYQKGRGLVAPRPEIDDLQAPYALKSSQEFGETAALMYVSHLEDLKGFRSNAEIFDPCGEATKESASYCVKPLLTQKQAFQALIDIYFAGVTEEFDRLNAKEEFVYRKENLIEDMIKDGLLDPGDTSDLTFTKVKSGLYIAKTWRDHPAYKVTYELIPKGDKYAVKVTATRIPIDPKAQKKEGE